VLVKWWLLAIPHYIVLSFFVGGGFSRDSGGGLIGILVLIAGVVLLFRTTYPQPIFDLVVGLNRWCYRVAAYAGLMTDEYPPFRLDQGGADPAGGSDPGPEPTTGATTDTPS
jgi:hypothetical protein